MKRQMPNCACQWAGTVIMTMNLFCCSMTSERLKRTSTVEPGSHAHSKPQPLTSESKVAKMEGSKSSYLSGSDNYKGCETFHNLSTIGSSHKKVLTTHPDSYPKTHPGKAKKTRAGSNRGYSDKRKSLPKKPSTVKKEKARSKKKIISSQSAEISPLYKKKEATKQVKGKKKRVNPKNKSEMKKKVISSQSAEISSLYKKKETTKSVKGKKKRVNPKNKSELKSDYILYQSGSESVGFESEEIRRQLDKGEEFLDFSDLAKMKKIDIDQESTQNEISSNLRENPLLNWTCIPFSLKEEQNISSGCLDERIADTIKHSYNNPDGGEKLIEDMQQMYCYLKHVNELVVNNVKRGKSLMKKLVEEDPEFTQLRFDTDELTDHFSWVPQEVVAFEEIMDAMCYQWKCVVARYGQRKTP